MTDKTSIEPEGSQRLFTVVGSVADDIADALARVKAIRSNLHEPWGTDEYGQRFAQQREPVAENALAGLDQTVAFVDGLSTEGRATIADFVSLDDHNGTNLAQNP